MRRLIVLSGLFVIAVTTAAARPFLRCIHAPVMPVPHPYDTRSDSINILNYAIDLDITDFAAKVIRGNTTVLFVPKVAGIGSIALDLMDLTVDSVKKNGNLLPYTHTNDLLEIALQGTFGTADTLEIEVFYHGTPSYDPTFGGFYFQSGFAYNVGVSLSDIPHNYGKTWFPCFDNFTERTTYDLSITTQSVHAAVCSGMPLSETDNGNGTKTFRWRVAQTIPSYLVSVAVAGYTYVRDGYISISGDTIPVWLAARPSDTTAMKNSFQNLEQAFHIFEDHYGPYQWPRVGYSLVPMTGGAMEHAMNIAYPIVLANGSLTYQDVMAHELSHMWWGNLVTCRTAEDMWINEGMATYSEYIFNEVLNGPQAYRTLVRDYHKELLRKAHIDDNGYWPVSGVPQQYTYGSTTYLKGADMVHSLRAYLGDAAFFSGLKQLLAQNAYSDIDADEFRDDLSAITGVNLSDYFDAWIYQGGWPHFAVDSFSSEHTLAGYDVKVYFRQKLAGRSSYANGVPVTVTFMDASRNAFNHTAVISGNTDMASFMLPTLPVFCGINMDEKLSQAVTAEAITIGSPGAAALPHAYFNITTSAVTDSAFVFVEHNWVHADWTPDYSISPQRYWKVSGVWNQDFEASAQISYDGRTSGTGYLDHLMITAANMEDSIVLLYRPGPGWDWTEHPGYTKTMGSMTDRFGSVVIHSLKQGEYAFALRGFNVGMAGQQAQRLEVFPNPAAGNSQLRISIPGNYSITVYSTSGKIMHSRNNLTSGTYDIPSEGWTKGIYHVCLYSGKRLAGSRKLVKQ